MAKPAQLEAFELMTGRDAAADEPSEDWVAGHAEGYAQGLADADAEQGRLTSELVTALDAQSLGYFEARDHLMRALRPMFEQLVTVLVPGLARAALPGMISEALMQMAAERLDQPLTLVVAPQSHAAIEALVAQIGEQSLHVQQDPQLGPNQAMIRGGAAEEIVDLDAILTEAQEALSALISETEARA